MLQLVSDGLNYLTAQSAESLLRMFWFLILNALTKPIAPILSGSPNMSRPLWRAPMKGCRSLLS